MTVKAMQKDGDEIYEQEIPDDTTCSWCDGRPVFVVFEDKGDIVEAAVFCQPHVEMTAGGH